MLAQEARADIRRHDDDRVLEIDRVAETIRQMAVFKHLQQDVVHIRMRLLDFIEQDDGVRIALHAFRELSAFLVSDVARR